LGQTLASRRIHQAATARNDRCSLCPKEEKSGSPNPLLGQARAGGVAAAATATAGRGFIRRWQNTAQKFAIV